MKLGMVGLGKMGANMTRRLVDGGHEVVGYDMNAEHVKAVVAHGASGAESLDHLISQLDERAIVWLMVPAGELTERVLADLSEALKKDDIIIDGGNSNYKDSIRRHGAARGRGLRYIDAGTSGGVWGLELGYCLMVGGDDEPVSHVTPIFEALAPADGFAHVGGPGAGHFVKMIHNGIEYGMMQAYAEGFEILNSSAYDLDLKQIAGVWRHGSVVRSWLLDLLERALEDDPGLEKITGYVNDSGEGRWTVKEAIDLDVPALSLTHALMARFRSRQENTFADRTLAALRNQFGGHAVKKAK
ncbi:MAG TPA: decarboxylating 6-phosphogluconate dehydrogenase [candidate division Zixibacteria bacterium]|nr:decarboxylating 6-phosphogluconate dehydrogenase [candidate division Zixibacteria bacterium]